MIIQFSYHKCNIHFIHSIYTCVLCEQYIFVILFLLVYTDFWNKYIKIYLCCIFTSKVLSGKTCFDCVMNDDKLNNWNDIFLILSKTHTRTIINKNTFWLEKDYKSYSIDIVLLNPLHCALSLVINSAIPCFWEAFIVLPSIWPGRACSVCYPCLLSTFPHYIYRYIYLSWKKTVQGIFIKLHITKIHNGERNSTV